MQQLRTGLHRQLLSAAIASACAATLFTAPAALAQGTNLQPNESSATGAKIDTPIIETPQFISVISSEEFRNHGTRNFNKALACTPGVSRQEGAEHTTESLRVRGFTVLTTYRDGSKYQANVYDGQQELYGLERLEVLKGSSSILYGVASPGGIINAVSKRPTSEPLREMNIEADCFDRRQISANFSEALDENGVLSDRLTMLHRDSDILMILSSIYRQGLASPLPALI